MSSLTATCLLAAARPGLYLSVGGRQGLSARAVNGQCALVQATGRPSPLHPPLCQIPTKKKGTRLVLRSALQ
jgi:hypothetical protein